MGKFEPKRRMTDEQLEQQVQEVIRFLKAVHPGLMNTDGYRPCVELRPIPRGVSKEDKRYFPLTWSLNIWDLSEESIERLRQFLLRHNGQPTCLFYSVFTYDNNKKGLTKKGQPAKTGKITTDAALETEEIALDFDDIDFDGYVQLVDRFEELGLYALWVFSGHGYQAHILLKEPLAQKGSLRKIVYKFRSKGFNCDVNCTDPSRIMRLPGTYNNKCFKDEKYAAEREAPPLCTIVQDSAERYSLTDLLDKLDTLPTVSTEDEEAFLSVTSKAPATKAVKEAAKEETASSDTDIAKLKLIEYPYLAEYDVPDAVERMLAYTPQGYRNKSMGFMIRFFKNQYKLGKRQIQEILELWGTEACDPPYEPTEFKEDFTRLYYHYNGLSYDPALAKKFGTIDFGELVQLRKKDIIIPHQFFQDFEELGGKEVRLYLAIKLLEHTEEVTSQEALSNLLGISTRSLRPTLQNLIKSGHCYQKKGNKKQMVPNTYYTNRLVSTHEGYMTFSYNDIRAYVMELCEQGERTRGNGELKLYLFFRWKFFSGEIYMSQSNLGKHLGLAQTSISHIVNRLADRHFLKIEKVKHGTCLESCEYTLLR